LIHTALSKKIALGDFNIRIEPWLTIIVIIRRKWIVVVIEPIFLDRFAVELVIETLNFLFIQFLVKSMRVPATVDFVDKILLLFD
jgi:hypothetical protein